MSTPRHNVTCPECNRIIGPCTWCNDGSTRDHEADDLCSNCGCDRPHLKYDRAVLCYQNGIANVFAVKCFNMAPYGRDAIRLSQGAFTTCESIARGMSLAGTLVASAHCKQAGDIINAIWSDDIDAMVFRDAANPVYSDGVFNPTNDAAIDNRCNYGYGASHHCTRTRATASHYCTEHRSPALMDSEPFTTTHD